MAARLLKSLLPRRSNYSQRQRGFTLVELLVGMIIASLVVTGLLSLVVRLQKTNQNESIQTETQRDLQFALDYINSDLREAVYVYSGECLQGRADDATTPNVNEFCPGVVNHIITTPANSVPVLAFWKLDPLPPPLQTLCNDSDPNTPAANLDVPCNSGRTYTLVVYFLRKNLASDSPQWVGKARITRYELPKYLSDGTEITTNYVKPDQPGVNFRIWPYQSIGNSVTNLQATRPTNTNPTIPNNPNVLVDFVDDTARTGDSPPTTSDPNSLCANLNPNPTQSLSDVRYNAYRISPTATATPFSSNMRSFYACVKVGAIRDQAGNIVGTGVEEVGNQDVFVFLRGNASGKPGVGNDSFLPTVQTQILRRGIVNKEPTAVQ